MVPDLTNWSGTSALEFGDRAICAAYQNDVHANCTSHEAVFSLTLTILPLGPSATIIRSSVHIVKRPTPTNRVSQKLGKFVFGEEDEHEEALYGRANHRVAEGSRGRRAGKGAVQQARLQ